MAFTVSIETEGDAFAEGGRSLEVSRLLQELAAKLKDYGDSPGSGTLKDGNGNTCGRWEMDEN